MEGGFDRMGKEGEGVPCTACFAAVDEGGPDMGVGNSSALVAMYGDGLGSSKSRVDSVGEDAGNFDESVDNVDDVDDEAVGEESRSNRD